MDINEYKQRVIALFKSGNAADEQWNEMADAVLRCVENGDGCEVIDTEIVLAFEAEGKRVRFFGE